jgi:OOP family OmpA-OmpF porin
MKVRQIAVVCSLLGATTVGHAEGFYVLGSVGQSHFREDVSGSDIEARADSLGIDVTSSKVDKKDTGYKVQVGYQFNQNFSIEGGYVDLGKEELKLSGDYFGNTVRASGKGEASGYNVAALLTLPINAGFSLFFKAGIIDAKVEVSSDASFAGASSSVSDNVRKIKPNVGVGVSYNFISALSARIEAERFSKLGDDDIGETNVDLFSVGLSYMF